jgi:hypothetical protein
MIQLGSFDQGIAGSACEDYRKQVEAATRLSTANVTLESDKLVFRPCVSDAGEPMSVARMQEALKAAGFFPGAKVDGICGYRTLSAMRLFQEYVRSYEKLPSVPDGRFGKASQQHLKRWTDNRIKTAWEPAIARWQAGTPEPGEYADWISLLETVRVHYAAQPNRILQKVNDFGGATDTRKVAQWDFNPSGSIHLVGIRRNEASGRFDDVFVLLIKGLVFKFQGSTEPGAAQDPSKGAPFLVQGQHDYHFGWHRSQYLALRPMGKGVLVVRSKGDLRLDDADLNNPLEPNATINIHWGGRGMTAEVKNWSEGCQVINGTLYINEKDELVDCSGFAAVNNKDISGAKTRGAYNVLVDLVTALGSDLPGNSVKYTLLAERDLDLKLAVKQRLAETRARVGRLLG